MFVGLKRATKGLKKAVIKSVNVHKMANFVEKINWQKMALHIDFT